MGFEKLIRPSPSKLKREKVKKVLGEQIGQLC